MANELGAQGRIVGCDVDCHKFNGGAERTLALLIFSDDFCTLMHNFCAAARPLRFRLI